MCFVYLYHNNTSKGTKWFSILEPYSTTKKRKNTEYLLIVYPNSQPLSFPISVYDFSELKMYHIISNHLSLVLLQSISAFPRTYHY